ncbi:glycosyltransferase family 1 protein [uncultured Litoreibacter sp.]|uniref:glycosyltransferase family 4 protein n=1 Tax=uncultured Litoreibacter sp. TaxID=1392394 RepID=UPI00262BF758|nr:glycosyltransferase family 1 protein [uncultured Litoreibacter sp.]
MLGAGTNPDITTSRDFPVVLDITRLVSRVGLGPMTGVDRVEFAYLNWCLGQDRTPVFCLARTADGYVLLDRKGAIQFRERLLGLQPWGSRDLRAKLGFKTPKARGAAESDLRRLAIARSGKTSLPDIPMQNGVYLNTGHSNLTEATLNGFRGLGLKVVVLIHDMIPLDWPEFQRDGTVQSFERKMKLVAAKSDLIITNSADTQQRAKHYFERWGRQINSVSSLLGVESVSEKIPNSGNNRPYFVSIGTIEPRKNHAFLLDIWSQLEAEMSPAELPNLHLVGRRGWNNEELFKRLDGLRGTPWLREQNDLDDVGLRRLLAGSHGLLYPSFAEGFGFPSIEAAQLGVPVICGDLAIHHEVLSDYPVYADLQDIYLWKKTIVEQAKQRHKDLIHANKAKTPRIPKWSEHFQAVNAAVTKLF